MVEVICEKTGVKFEAASKRTKNHPKIMAIVNESYKDGWYQQCMDAIKAGRENGLSSIEDFLDLLKETEQAAKSQQQADYSAMLQRQREIKDAKRQKAITNAFLREHGYMWKRFENDEEDIDLHGLPEVEWTLYSPDQRVVSTKDAMQELAAQNIKFAIDWLTERGIAIVAPEPEPIEKMQARVKDTAETHAIAEAIHDAQTKRIKTGKDLQDHAEQRSKPFPDPALYIQAFTEKYQKVAGEM